MEMENCVGVLVFQKELNFLWELGFFVAFGRLDPLLDLSVLSPVLLHVVMSEFLIAAQ